MITITIGKAGAGLSDWLPIVQMFVTALSAGVAAFSAHLTAKNFNASRRDRLRTDVDETTAAIVEAWKLGKAIVRAGQAFDPELVSEERERLRNSALAELGGVSARTVWPSKLDMALIDVRRLLEDTGAGSSEAVLVDARTRLMALGEEVTSSIKTLADLNDKHQASIDRLK